MQTRNKIFDDLSELMTNALGVAQGAKDEADTAFKGVIDRWVADKDLVSREEFEVLQIMLKKLSKENADDINAAGGVGPDGKKTLESLRDDLNEYLKESEIISFFVLVKDL